jgi:hypothetical protein
MEKKLLKHKIVINKTSPPMLQTKGNADDMTTA